MKIVRRVDWFILSTAVLLALVGGVYRSQARAASGSADSNIEASLNAFTRVYAIVEANYADPVNPDTAIYGSQSSSTGAIPAALRTLDPHSNFFDPRAYALLREDTEGKYYGVGMSIGAGPGTMGESVTMVLTPTPESPAFRAGLRPGDIVAKVDGKSTEGLNISQVAGMLKGPKGTQVRVTIVREGSDQPLEFVITRDEIPTRNVDEAFLIRPGIAYIRIAKFASENTNNELSDALRKVGEQTLQGLILDLRGNPGGLVTEAVDVSDHFLEKRKLIVYYSGRHTPEQQYLAVHGNDGREYPIVVLVNRMTASAAEIVAGALQDHDRALVIGETTFGKGLVQSIYELSEHTAMTLTTAHYYTPSGRLIQRPYENVSLYDYYYHPELTKPAHVEVRQTDGGREVHGGGGITPDIAVPDPKLSPEQDSLLRRSAFFDFGRYYLGIHNTIPRDFQVTDAVMDEFKQFMAKEKIPFSEQNVTTNLDFIKNHIRTQLVGAIYGENEADRISIADDPLVLKGLDSMPQAETLMANAKLYVLSKTQQR